MNNTTFIAPPHFGQASGSTSYTRLMSIAQVALQRTFAGGASHEDTGKASATLRAASAASAAFRRMPRDLFEYQP